MIKALFMKWFAELIKPFADRLEKIENAIDIGYGPTGGGIAEVEEYKRKPLIAKSVALNNLAEYIKGFETAKGMMAGRQVGSEIEFYERNNKTLKTEVLHGVAAIEGFIARARKDEVRLVRQVR